MSAEEVERFRAEPDWEEAVALRLIDDRGKVAGAQVPGLASYRALLARVVAAARASEAARGLGPSHNTGNLVSGGLVMVGGCLGLGG